MSEQLGELKKQLEMETSAKRDFKAESEEQEKELEKLRAELGDKNRVSEGAAETI